VKVVLIRFLLKIVCEVLGLLVVLVVAVVSVVIMRSS